MMELNNTFKLKFITILKDLTGFYGEDFTYDTSEKDDSSIKFLIKNKFNTNIYFEITIYVEKRTFENEEIKVLGRNTKVKSYAFDVIMQPGQFFALDEINCGGEKALFDTFEEWVKRAWNEYNASSLIRKLQMHEDKIQEMNEKIENEYFTIEQAENLKLRLEELEKLLQEHIKSREDEDEDKEKEIEKLKNDIEFLTNSLEVLSTRNWFDCFLSRFSHLKLDKEKRKILLKFGGKGLGNLIEAKTGNSTIKDIIEEITK